MRSKIIVVNAGIVILVALLSYVLLATSLKSVVADPAERKHEVEGQRSKVPDPEPSTFDLRPWTAEKRRERRSRP